MKDEDIVHTISNNRIMYAMSARPILALKKVPRVWLFAN